MNNFFYSTAIVLSVLVNSCHNTDSGAPKQKNGLTEDSTFFNEPEDDFQTENLDYKNISDSIFRGFLPKGYVVFEQIQADLNDDKLIDYIIVIKGTNKENIVENFSGNLVDRNRRGILVLLNKGSNYELVVENANCFSSENEDGGVYFPPELSLMVKNDHLHIEYAAGRYGYWKYIFRFTNSDFELVGYFGSADRGPVVCVETSIDFLTKKKRINTNTNLEAEPGEEVFEETWETLNDDELIKLSEIKDFDDLNF